MKKKCAWLLAVWFYWPFTLPVFAAGKTQTIRKGQKVLTIPAGTQVTHKVKGRGKARWAAKNTSVYQLTAKGLLKTKNAGTEKLKYKVGFKKYTIKLVVKKKGNSSASKASTSVSNNR